MLDIRVETSEKSDGWEIHVQVTEGPSSTNHTVRLSRSSLKKLGLPDKTDISNLVRESFLFLLEREPKESILAKFELTLIGDYFPEYPDEIRKRVRS